MPNAPQIKKDVPDIDMPSIKTQQQKLKIAVVDGRFMPLMEKGSRREEFFRSPEVQGFLAIIDSLQGFDEIYLAGNKSYEESGYKSCEASFEVLKRKLGKVCYLNRDGSYSNYIDTLSEQFEITVYAARKEQAKEIYYNSKSSAKIFLFEHDLIDYEEIVTNDLAKAIQEMDSVLDAEKLNLTQLTNIIRKYEHAKKGLPVEGYEKFHSKYDLLVEKRETSEEMIASKKAGEAIAELDSVLRATQLDLNRVTQVVQKYKNPEVFLQKYPGFSSKYSALEKMVTSTSKKPQKFAGGGTIVGGMLLGALFGSFVPVIGTFVGAIFGALIGVVVGGIFGGGVGVLGGKYLSRHEDEEAAQKLRDEHVRLEDEQHTLLMNASTIDVTNCLDQDDLSFRGDDNLIEPYDPGADQHIIEDDPYPTNDNDNEDALHREADQHEDDGLLTSGTSYIYGLLNHSASSISMDSDDDMSDLPSPSKSSINDDSDEDIEDVTPEVSVSSNENIEDTTPTVSVSREEEKIPESGIRHRPG